MKLFFYQTRLKHITEYSENVQNIALPIFSIPVEFSYLWEKVMKENGLSLS